MGLSQLWLSVLIVLLFHGKWLCDGCWDDERIALLKLKAYFNSSDSVALDSWGKIPNCCYWECVECSPVTGRVTSLHLRMDWSWTSADWYLNASLFVPFKELKRLSLVDFNIAGCVENEGSSLAYSFNYLVIYVQFKFICFMIKATGCNSFPGFERLWNLDNLESLDLSMNKFINTILPSLSGFSSLKSLNLDDNRLKGIIDIQGEFHFLPPFSERNNISKTRKWIVKKNQLNWIIVKFLIPNWGYEFDSTIAFVQYWIT